MLDPPLDIGDVPAGIALVPGPVELLRGGLKLDDKVASRAIVGSVLSVATIRRAELTEDKTSMTAANDLAVRRAFEAVGVEFIDGSGGGPGVRLRKARQHGKRK